MTDPWGIEGQYEDALGEAREISSATRNRLLASMDADPDSVPREGSVLLVSPNSRVCLTSPGELILESGEKVGLTEELPRDLPAGYHQLRSLNDGEISHIICSPGECWLPERLRIWGWSFQLPCLRSRTSWGMGDLGDLRRFAEWSAMELRAGVLMINPLGAPAPVLPQQPSPYYPSSRRYRNPLYIRVEDVAGAAGIPEISQIKEEAVRLNQDRHLDRDRVFQLKMRALEKLWNASREPSDFEQYVTSEGDDLQRFATFAVLAEQFGGGWRSWPSMYQAPDSPDVSAFREANSERVRFHAWLQWLIDTQLARASEKIALMQDLPIGVDPGGADAWSWQELLARDVAVGAPPDEFNTQGQNWGLPPFIPHKLRSVGYQPFVQTIRATLRHGGGLRIDHVMGLFRLFWIPSNSGAAEGGYVRYRADEMLAIVAIESQRAQAFVVGEDLGTLEAGVRETLQSHKVLSYRLLWFEKDPPSTYPEMALAAVTTHDLPTIAGLWSGSDLAAQKRLNLSPNEEGVKETRDRLGTMLDVKADAPVEQIIEKTYGLLSSAPSYILTAAVDDMLSVEERPNMPATIDEWPNWSIALPKPLEEIERLTLPRTVAKLLRRTHENT